MKLLGLLCAKHSR
uniref:Uncharacterized protein n=1 Tax=Arundo donax TaxID=35708 RepID=A0A0A8Z074_ARUDO